MTFLYGFVTMFLLLLLGVCVGAWIAAQESPDPPARSAALCVVMQGGHDMPSRPFAPLAPGYFVLDPAMPVEEAQAVGLLLEDGIDQSARQAAAWRN